MGGIDAVATVELTPAAAAPDDDAARKFAALLDRRNVRVVFQPLVDLRSGQIVALEALARGPEGTQFASPLALFAAARRAGRVAELDWVCRTAAFRAVLEAGIPPAMSLFVNVEAEAIATECPADLAHLASRAESVLRVFVEVNDQAIAADPAGLLAAVDRARSMGWGIAIDDVGASRAPLAMLPIVQADIVKLDLRRLQETGPLDASAIVTSVLRYVERSGAALMVEGIETEDDAKWARALGASYGQGYLLGAPGPLQAQYAVPHTPVRLIGTTMFDQEVDSPFDLLEGRPCERMGRELLDRLALMLSYSPRSFGTWPVSLLGIGRDGKLPDLLIEHGAPLDTLLFVAFGTDLDDGGDSDVHRVRLRRNDPLAEERFFIVLGDQAPTAIFARPAPDERYDVVVSHDHDLVYAIAHHLIRRVPGPGKNNVALPMPERVVAVDDAASAGPALAPKRGWRGRLAAR